MLWLLNALAANSVVNVDGFSEFGELSYSVCIINRCRYINDIDHKSSIVLCSNNKMFSQ